MLLKQSSGNYIGVVIGDFLFEILKVSLTWNPHNSDALPTELAKDALAQE